MTARRISIRGKLQGVFFREWVVARAKELDISGWVRNRADGSVEVHGSGADAQLERFIDKLREGAPAAQVDGLEIASAVDEDVVGFVRRRTE